MSDVEGAIASRGKAMPDGSARHWEGITPCSGRDFSPDELLELATAGADWIWETDAELQVLLAVGQLPGHHRDRPEQGAWPLPLRLPEASRKSSSSAAAHLEDLQARRPFRDFVYEVKDARSDCRWVSVTGFPRYDANGAFLGYRGIGRNATLAAQSVQDVRNVDREEAVAAAGGAVIELEPRQAGHALEAEQAKALFDLERVLDAMRLGVVLVDADLKTLIINKAYRSLSKIAPDEAPVGSHFRVLMETIRCLQQIYDVDDDRWEAYVESRLAEIRAGDVAPREFRHADGPRWSIR